MRATVCQLHDSTLLMQTPGHRASDRAATALHEVARTAAPFYGSMAMPIEVLAKRRSMQSAGDMPAALFADWLRLSLFATNASGRRPYPAAGAVYSIHVYCAAQAIAGIDVGTYYIHHADEVLLSVADAAQTNAFCRDYRTVGAAVALLIADTRLAALKYHDRAWRMAMLEAGAIMQNMCLAATHLRMTACPLGALSDRGALQLCGRSADEGVAFACGVALGMPTNLSPAEPLASSLLG